MVETVLTLIFCTLPCVYVYPCVWLCAHVCQGFCAEVEDSLRYESFPSTLFETGLGLLTVVCAKLAATGASGGFSCLCLLSWHRSMGIRDDVFMWVIGPWSLVLTLGQQVFCHWVISLAPKLLPVHYFCLFCSFSCWGWNVGSPQMQGMHSKL